MTQTNSIGWRARWVLSVAAAVASTECLVDEKCTASSDCDSGQLCLPSGECETPSVGAAKCTIDTDCGAGLVCSDGTCVLAPPEEAQEGGAPAAAAGAGAAEPGGGSPGGYAGEVIDASDSAGHSGAGFLPEPSPCPDDMVLVAEAFCIDRWEASRPDATVSGAGVDESKAQSVAGVLPWLVADNESAQAACVAVGKSLCTAAQWQLACEGADATTYSYGDTYQPETCNGIDAFGRSDFHLEPTGAFPDCQSSWGAFDLNGNVWEHVLGGDGRTVRGGAYNCGDSQTYHRCDYVPTSWTPQALGFRCCGEKA